MELFEEVDAILITGTKIKVP